MMLAVVLAFFFVVSGANKARMRSALAPGRDETARDRLIKWKAGMKMFSDHPLLGVGPGNYAPEYRSEYPTWHQRKLMAIAPHSIFVEGLSELGLAGFIPLLTLWLLIARLNAGTRKVLRSLAPERSRGFEYDLSWGLDLALVGFLVSGAFLSVLYYPHMWVLLGLSAALYRAAEIEAAANRQPEFGHGNWPAFRSELSAMAV
jgi:O-antigen ligase